MGFCRTYAFVHTLGSTLEFGRKALAGLILPFPLLPPPLHFMFSLVFLRARLDYCACCVSLKPALIAGLASCDAMFTTIGLENTSRIMRIHGSRKYTTRHHLSSE